MKNKLLLIIAFWISFFVPVHGQSQTELVGGRTTVDTRDSILDEWLTGHVFEVDTRDSIELVLSSNSISENQLAGSEIGRFSVAGGGSASYSLVSGTGSSGNSNFTLSTTGILKSSKSFDYEKSSKHSIRVRGASSGKMSVEKVFTINILDLDETPLSFALSSNSISENQLAGSEVGRFSVAGGGSASYSLVSGTGSSGNSNFTLSPDGVLKTAKSFDYERTQEHSIRVLGTASGKVPTEEDFTIKVLDEPELTFALSPSPSVVKENQPVGTEVGFFHQGSGARFPLPPSLSLAELPLKESEIKESGNAPSDPYDLPDEAFIPPPLENIYSLVDGEGATHNHLFDIRNEVLRTAAVLDFETAPILSIRVRDNVFSKAEQVFVITVEDTDEGLSFALSQRVVKENQPVGTEVGFFYQDIGGVPDAPSFAPSDLPAMKPQAHAGENHPGGNTMPDGPSILPHFSEIFTLVAGEGATHNHLFDIRNGVLRTAAVLDFETAPILSIRVKDKGFSKVEKVFKITVKDTEEPIQDEITLSNSSVMEKQPIGTEVGSLLVNGKVDSGYMFSLVGGKGGEDKAKFAVNGNILSTASVLNAAGSNSSLSIRVQAMKVSFVNGLPEFDLLDQTFTIQVQEQPATNGLVLSRDSVWEGLPVGTTLTKIGSLVNGVFVESGNEYSLTTGSGDEHNSWFTIEGNLVKANKPLDAGKTPVLHFRLVEKGTGLTQGFTLEVEKSNFIDPFKKPYEDALEILTILQGEVYDLNTTHRQNQDDLASGREENEGLQESLREKQAQLAKLEKENLGLAQREKELQGELASQEAKIVAAIERIADVNQRVSDSSARLSHLQEELATVREENESLREIAKVPHLKGWHFLPNQGWVLVDPDYYPLVYQSETNSWLTYEQGSSRPWNYYNHTTEKWEAWE